MVRLARTLQLRQTAAGVVVTAWVERFHDLRALGAPVIAQPATWSGNTSTYGEQIHSVG